MTQPTPPLVPSEGTSPESLAEAWADLEEAMVAKNLPIEIRNYARVAFYAGAVYVKDVLVREVHSIHEEGLPKCATCGQLVDPAGEESAALARLLDEVIRYCQEVTP